MSLSPLLMLGLLAFCIFSRLHIYRLYSRVRRLEKLLACPHSAQDRWIDQNGVYCRECNRLVDTPESFGGYP